jgi:hypothetical protein
MYLQSESEIMGLVMAALKEKGLDVRHIYRAGREIEDAVAAVKAEQAGLEEDQILFLALDKLYQAA